MRPIGGFFPLRIPGGGEVAASVLSTWTKPHNDVWALHNARSALHTLWGLTRPKRVWLPAYICREVAVAVPQGLELRFYPLDDRLCPRVDFLREHVRSKEHVLSVAYFGRSVNFDFSELVHARPDIGWIEDRAHSLITDGAPWGDWLIYSPRKLLGAPDGGILVSRSKPLPSVELVRQTDFSFALPMLQRFEDSDETDNDNWYQSHVRAEHAMSNGRLAMSRLSRTILAGVAIDVDAESRRSNFRYLQSRLSTVAFITEAGPAFTPFGFPIRVKSAAAMAQALAKERIFAARHWAILPSDPVSFRTEHLLADQLLTLPCDYRYGVADMDRVSTALLKHLSGE